MREVHGLDLERELSSWLCKSSPPRMNKLETSNVIAIAAAVTAVISLGATFWQAHLTRVHNQLSVRPHLDWGSNLAVNGQPLTLELVNHGLGPAIISLCRIRAAGFDHDGKQIEFPEPMKRAILASPFGVEWTTPTPGTPLPAGGKVALFKCHIGTGDPVRHEAAVAFLKDVSLDIAYSSMYGEQFTMTKQPKA